MKVLRRIILRQIPYTGKIGLLSQAEIPLNTFFLRQERIFFSAIGINFLPQDYKSSRLIRRHLLIIISNNARGQFLLPQKLFSLFTKKVLKKNSSIIQQFFSMFKGFSLNTTRF